MAGLLTRFHNLLYVVFMKLETSPSPCQVAEGALFSLRALQGRREELGVPSALYPSLPWSVQLEEAKLYWERGEAKLAMGHLKSLLQVLAKVSFLP